MQWSPCTAAAVRSALSRAAASPTLAGLSAQPYALEFEGSSLFGLSARLGPAYHKPGWSTHAFLEIFDPAHPNLGILTVLDRRDSDGLPHVGAGNPRYTLALDNRLVRRFIPTARLTLAGLDPTRRHRCIVMLRHPGRTTIGDGCAVPLWLAFLLRGCAWQTQLALIIVDFKVFERTARVMANLLGRRNLHLFPATSEPSPTPMRLAPVSGKPHSLEFSTATDVGIATARRYLEQHQQRLNEPASV